MDRIHHGNTSSTIDTIASNYFDSDINVYTEPDTFNPHAQSSANLTTVYFEDSAGMPIAYEPLVVRQDGQEKRSTIG